FRAAPGRRAGHRPPPRAHGPPAAERALARAPRLERARAADLAEPPRRVAGALADRSWDRARLRPAGRRWRRGMERAPRDRGRVVGRPALAGWGRASRAHASR